MQPKLRATLDPAHRRIRPHGLRLLAREVRLAPSAAAWQTAYERVSSKLRAALGELAIAIEHVGSTAVPGLPTKPVLDVGVHPSADQDALVDVVQSLGFVARGSVEDNGGTTKMFRHRLVNLHVVPHDGRRWRD